MRQYLSDMNRVVAETRVLEDNVGKYEPLLVRALENDIDGPVACVLYIAVRRVLFRDVGLDLCAIDPRALKGTMENGKGEWCGCMYFERVPPEHREEPLAQRSFERPALTCSARCPKCHVTVSYGRNRFWRRRVKKTSASVP